MQDQYLVRNNRLNTEYSSIISLVKNFLTHPTMGKKQHQKDKMYITATEWREQVCDIIIVMTTSVFIKLRENLKNEISVNMVRAFKQSYIKFSSHKFFDVFCVRLIQYYFFIFVRSLSNNLTVRRKKKEGGE